MAGAAGIAFHFVLTWWLGRSTELLDIANERLRAEDLVQLLSRNAQLQDGRVSIHLRRNRRIKRVRHAQFFGQGLNARVLKHVGSHQHIRDRDL